MGQTVGDQIVERLREWQAQHGDPAAHQVIEHGVEQKARELRR